MNSFFLVLCWFQYVLSKEALQVVVKSLDCGHYMRRRAASSISRLPARHMVGRMGIKVLVPSPAASKRHRQHSSKFEVALLSFEMSTRAPKFLMESDVLLPSPFCFLPSCSSLSHPLWEHPWQRQCPWLGSHWSPPLGGGRSGISPRINVVKQLHHIDS